MMKTRVLWLSTSVEEIRIYSYYSYSQRAHFYSELDRENKLFPIFLGTPWNSFKDSWLRTTELQHIAALHANSEDK